MSGYHAILGHVDPKDRAEWAEAFNAVDLDADAHHADHGSVQRTRRTRQASKSIPPSVNTHANDEGVDESARKRKWASEPLPTLASGHGQDNSIATGANVTDEPMSSSKRAKVPDHGAPEAADNLNENAAVTLPMEGVTQDSSLLESNDQNDTTTSMEGPLSTHDRLDATAPALVAPALLPNPVFTAPALHASAVEQSDSSLSSVPAFESDVQQDPEPSRPSRGKGRSRGRVPQAAVSTRKSSRLESRRASGDAAAQQTPAEWSQLPADQPLDADSSDDFQPRRSTGRRSTRTTRGGKNNRGPRGGRRGRGARRGRQSQVAATDPPVLADNASLTDGTVVSQQHGTQVQNDQAQDAQGLTPPNTSDDNVGLDPRVTRGQAIAASQARVAAQPTLKDACSTVLEEWNDFDNELVVVGSNTMSKATRSTSAEAVGGNIFQISTDEAKTRTQENGVPSGEPCVLPSELTSHGSCDASARFDPTGEPPVWAERRQALCETLPYYRSYHGGGYCTAGHARSFMFDSQGHQRDYLDSNVFISRAGGGLSRNKETGIFGLEKDQTVGSQVKSVRMSIEHKVPVAIIVGESLPHAQFNIPHPYCVLDWFKITHVWSERSNGKVIFRYRFEKLDPSNPSWWTPKGHQASPLGKEQPPHEQACSTCHLESEQVYVNGWMCLNKDCTKFWTLPNGNAPNEEELQYDKRFLKQYTHWEVSSAPQPLFPTFDHEEFFDSELKIDSTWASVRGLACPNCKLCNSRVAWKQWKCGHCNQEYPIRHPTIPPAATRSVLFPLSDTYASSRDTHTKEIDLSVKYGANYRANIFTIPGIKGCIVHLIANKLVVEEAGGPDDMWVKLQELDIGLRRREMGGGVKGGMLTQHFALNYGMPYKYIAKTQSESFDAASEPIRAARSRMIWAARALFGDKVIAFNELLALGYLQGQKIDFHDDGEKGLGPTIATLSLGCSATMAIRMKQKHQNGLSKSGGWNDVQPLEISKNWFIRSGLINWMNSHEDRRTPEIQKEAASWLQKAVMGREKGRVAPELLHMHLSHGDIVIMHGAEIQQYFEHSVTPHGNTRFALTCRYIDPQSLKEEERSYEVRPDDLHYDGGMLAPANDIPQAPLNGV